LCFGGWVVFSAMLWWFFLLLMELALLPSFFCFFGGDSRGMSLSWLELASSELNNCSCVEDERWRSCGRPQRWRWWRLRGICRRDWSLCLGDYNVTFGPQYDTVNLILDFPFAVTSWDV
jgi:hypothetical protein